MPLPFFLILYVDEIFDALSWLFNVIIKLVAKNATDPFSSEAPDLKGVNAIVKAMLQFIYWIVDFIGQISTKLLILLRSFTLYV